MDEFDDDFFDDDGFEPVEVTEFYALDNELDACDLGISDDNWAMGTLDPNT